MKAKFMYYIILLNICTFLVGCTTKNEVVLPESIMDISPSVGEIIPSPTSIISTPLDTIPTPTIAPNKDSSDLSTLSEMQDKLLMDLYIKEDIVYMLYEPYTP